MKQTESIEQKKVINWAEANKVHDRRLSWLFHVPNGGLRSKRQAVEMVCLGVKKGISDLILLVPSRGYNYFCGEMKAPGINDLGPDQEKFKRFVIEQNGFYCVYNKAQGMVDEIKFYLKMAFGD